MKKAATIFTSLCLSLFLLSCGGNGQDGPDGPDKPIDGSFVVDASQSTKGQVIFKGRGNNGTGTYDIPMDFDYSKVQLMITLAQAHNYVGDSNYFVESVAFADVESVLTESV